MNRLIPVLLALTPTLALAQTVAVTGAKIIPVAGDPIESGTVLIQGGRIVSVGPTDAVKVPYDATVIEAEGKVVFPGMVLAHTTSGLDRSNESLPVTPFLDVYDGINPASFAFEELLREGVTTAHVIQANETTIGGVGRVLQPLGLTLEAMTVLAPSGLKISVSSRRDWDRIRQRAQLREAFAELEDYLDRVAEKRFAEEQKKAGKEDEKVAPAKAREAGRELIRDEDLDAKHLNLYLLTRGRLDAYVYCELATDVPYAVAMALELGFLERTTLVLGGECWKAAAMLAEIGRPVILPPSLTWRETDPITGEEEEVFVAAALAEAGVSFSLSVSPQTSFAERYLWYQAARCVAYGVSRQEALKSITLAPAQAIGVAEQVGSLEPGKLGNLLILSGDPLDATTHVEQVLLEGKVVYLRSKDFRLRKLLRGELTGGSLEPDEHPHPEEGEAEEPQDEDDGPDQEPKDSGEDE